MASNEILLCRVRRGHNLNAHQQPLQPSQVLKELHAASAQLFLLQTTTTCCIYERQFMQALWVCTVLLLGAEAAIMTSSGKAI